MDERDRILVLEDDRPLMEGIRDMLELQGYIVLTASNGVEGLQLLRSAEQPPSLIISDIMMPEMDGYAFLNAVREDKRWIDIPFIFLTAKSEKSDLRMGFLAGADDYVTKPFEAEDLVVRVNNKLRRKREADRVRDAEVTDIKRRILTILHHEFRTPLTYVVAYSDMLNREADQLTAADMRTFLNGISSGADRLRRLVENFIFLVELETGEAQNTYNWRKRPLDNLPQIVESAIQLSQSFADDRRVKLECRLPDHPLPKVVGDAEYLRVCLARLIDNGIKFSDKPESTVTVSAHADDHSVYLSVSDQGRGIPISEQKRIFEPFHQIKRGVYEDQGAGAGLTIVQHIVNLHGGQIVLRSTPGQGSEFVVVLPAQND